MARIRSIKPEFWVSEQIAECSTSARLAFVGLWNFCDDRGVHVAKPKTLKAELFPMDDITSGQVGEWIAELIRVGLVREFEAPEDGALYWHVTGWDRHQKIDRPSYKHPAPPAQDSTSPRRIMLDEYSSNARRAPPPGVDRSGVDRKGEECSSPKARVPASSKSRSAVPGLVSPDVLVAAGFDAAMASEFVSYKERKKAPLTERAWKDHVHEAAKAGWTPQEAAEKVMAKGWKGFEAKYVADDRGRSGPRASTPLDADEVFAGGAR